MKNLFIGLGVIALLGATSCQKERTCECTADGQSESIPMEKAKKKDQKEACDALSAFYVLAGGSCELK